MKNKRQHFIPSSYLNAWCDSETLQLDSKFVPYVWVFSKDGSEVDTKPPDKLFFEKDLYTFHTQDGLRDLGLETSLSRLEGGFARLRSDKLDRKISISPKDHLVLCAFAAAMYGRTKAHADDWSARWQEVHALSDRVQEVWEGAGPEKRAAIESSLQGWDSDNERALSFEELDEIAAHPFHPTIEVLITDITPLLFKFPFAILEAAQGMSFITSDDPCVWFDPEGMGGLASPTLEITLPLSPKQLLFIGRQLATTGNYVPDTSSVLTEFLNRRTRAHSDRKFVSNRGELRFAWFS